MIESDLKIITKAKFHQLEGLNGSFIEGIHVSCWKKIIATTDKLNTHPNVADSYRSGNCLPQPSQSFIEKWVEEYNKGNVITDVMVEYEAMNTTIVNRTYNDFEPKINPKDNTITIRKIKDSWSREEVVELIKQYSEDINNPIWFKKNYTSYLLRSSCGLLKGVYRLSIYLMIISWIQFYHNLLLN
jgi:hypothetical protein